jgi:hypothetical protein
MVIPPVKVFMPLSVKVPFAVFCISALPETIPLSVRALLEGTFMVTKVVAVIGLVSTMLPLIVVCKVVPLSRVIVPVLIGLKELRVKVPSVT